MKLTNLPWSIIRTTGFAVRRVTFNVKKPNEAHIVVDASVNELTDMFRKQNYREGWFISYYYMGEDANLCRSEYKDDKYEDYQHHVRLFERDDGKTEIYTHYELDPIMHPRKHLTGVKYNHDKGIEMTEDVLKQYKPEYTVA